MKIDIGPFVSASRLNRIHRPHTDHAHKIDTHALACYITQRRKRTMALTNRINRINKRSRPHTDHKIDTQDDILTLTCYKIHRGGKGRWP